ncbi:MAG: hydroxymethylbilane synthase, partial [Actinobacteria bacterium]|nr:hydroxymethylbilane synthase [Actinomycetota bacterium]
EGGCSVPAGALATLDGARLSLQAGVYEPTGARFVSLTGDAAAAEELGRQAAEYLLARVAHTP